MSNQAEVKGGPGRGRATTAGYTHNSQHARAPSICAVTSAEGRCGTRHLRRRVTSKLMLRIATGARVAWSCWTKGNTSTQTSTALPLHFNRPATSNSKKASAPRACCQQAQPLHTYRAGRLIGGHGSGEADHIHQRGSKPLDQPRAAVADRANSLLSETVQHMQQARRI